MIRPLPRAGLWGSLGLVAIGCSRFEAEPQPARFEIAGAHAELVCEGCHTEGQPYQALPTDCRSCHEADRASPTHFADQTCNDAGCHTSADLTWSDLAGGTDFHDFLPLEGSHDLECTSCHAEGKDNQDLPGVSEYCWNCHEIDRKKTDDTPNGLHYVQYVGGDPKQPDPSFRWDCGPCHTPATWATGAFDHTPRSPHGTLVSDPADVEDCVPQPDPTDWVTGCVGCHPTSTAESQCASCHADSHFQGNPPSTCIDSGCHESAQPPDCDSLATPQ